MTVEERFKKLEKQNRRLRKWMAGTASLALAAALTSTAGWVNAYTANIDPREITSQRITLRDANGRVRIVLDGLNGVGQFYDTNNKMRINFQGTLGNGHFLDGNGVSRVVLAGSYGQAVFYDASAKQRVNLDGAAGWGLFKDSNGIARIGLNYPNMGYVTVYSSSNTVIKTLP